MITLYSGTPGAGKSLHLASRLYHWMQYRNAPIVANFSCDFHQLRNQKDSLSISTIHNLHQSVLSGSLKIMNSILGAGRAKVKFCL